MENSVVLGSLAGDRWIARRYLVVRKIGGKGEDSSGMVVLRGEEEEEGEG